MSKRSIREYITRTVTYKAFGWTNRDATNLLVLNPIVFALNSSHWCVRLCLLICKTVLRWIFYSVWTMHLLLGAITSSHRAEMLHHVLLMHTLILICRISHMVAHKVGNSINSTAIGSHIRAHRKRDLSHFTSCNNPITISFQCRMR